jgi:hypothetical protein
MDICHRRNEQVVKIKRENRNQACRKILTENDPARHIESQNQTRCHKANTSCR